MLRQSVKRTRTWIGIGIVAVIWVGGCVPTRPAPVAKAAKPFSTAPQVDTTWPWPSAVQTEIAPGVTRWSLNSKSGRINLFRFDFEANPRLEFGIYDQDQHDADPGNNLTSHEAKSVAGAVKELNAEGRVMAAWNGLFFAFDRSGYETKAAHIGPAVINGKPLYNVGGPHRWTFGITKEGRFKTVFQPKFKDLGEFQFAGDGAQCLILEGEPLKIEPYPSVPIEPGTKLTRAKPTPEAAGHIPLVDHIRTSRASIGWSKDSKKLYALIIQERDSENESARRLRAGEPLGDGWNLFDLQRFWKSMGVWGAINSDGGVVTQFIAVRQGGDYEMVPALSSKTTAEPLVLSPKFENLPDGGTLQYFYVRQRH